MSDSDLQEIKSAFGSLIDRLGRKDTSGKGVADAQQRLIILYSSLQAPCRICELDQQSLRELAQAANKHDKLEAGKNVTEMVSRGWETHKEWLSGVRRLVSAM